jgi:hypothetical protein
MWKTLTRNTLQAAAAAACLVVLVNPTGAAKLAADAGLPVSVDGAVAHADGKRGMDLRKRAVDTMSAKQKRAASAAPVGSLGAAGGHGHYAEIADGYRWSSCASIRFTLNVAGAPAGAAAGFRLAARKVSQATGLQLQVVGTTTAAPTADWARSQGKDSWNPVLVSWGADGTGGLSKGASATSELFGLPNAAGQGVWVSGRMRFNVETDYMYTPGFGSYGSRVALMMHEIGHMVGLDHVADDTKLMYPTVSGAADAGRGDMDGFAAMGSAGCVQVPHPSVLGWSQTPPRGH